ncbi:MAG TPA: RDD family protein [Candidatus Cybelea sp.]|nr:RDD family protein [Candidatus Cybelea sp.]
MQPILDGPASLREPSEQLAFWLTGLCAFPAALLIGYVLHESIGASQVALFIVIAMLYVTLARGRLLGSSVRINQRQYPRVFSIVSDACAALEIPMPMIFVREDNYVPAVALGFGEPYSLVLSSHWIELFSDDELAFMIGRELGHIAAGHTRFHSLLSVNGNENPLISLVFGAWLRRCALTCDKVGLLCCGSLDAAIRALGIASFHEFGRKVDYEAFASQQSEIANDSVLRWGEWLSGEPYATRRIASLRRFITSSLYLDAHLWFVRERSESPPALAAAGEARVTSRDCAGWWRRFTAWAIDAVIVGAIITSFGGSVAPVVVERTSAKHARPAATQPAATRQAATAEPSPEVTVGPLAFSNRRVAMKVGDDEVPLSFSVLGDIVGSVIGRLGFTFWFPVYLGVLVIVAGQTFGMLIAGLKVVTTDFRKPTITRTIARYLIAGFLWWLIAAFSLVWRRVLLHDRWTGTRLVKVERVVLRATGLPPT